MAFEMIKTDVQGSVALITINRPEALNALNSTVMSELARALDEFEADEAIGAVVLTGSEKAFAAGADIKEMAGKTYADAYNSDFIGMWERITHFRKPVIAAVSGYALGGGCELAMMCDIILAADNAKFGQPEINLGTLPGAGGTQRLTRAIGKSKAMEMCLTGRMLNAEEAERSNLVARVVPLVDLIDEATKLANTIADKSQPAVAMCKASVNVAFESTLKEGVRFERQTFYSSFALEDRKEGMAAFVEKRSPQFRNR